MCPQKLHLNARILLVSSSFTAQSPNHHFRLSLQSAFYQNQSRSHMTSLTSWYTINHTCSGFDFGPIHLLRCSATPSSFGSCHVVPPLLLRPLAGPSARCASTSFSCRSSLSLSMWWTLTCLCTHQSLHPKQLLTSDIISCAKNLTSSLRRYRGVKTYLCKLSGLGYLCSLSGQNGHT